MDGYDLLWLRILQTVSFMTGSGKCRQLTAMSRVTYLTA